MTTVSVPPPPRADLRRRYDAWADAYERALYTLQRRVKRFIADIDLTPTIKYRVKSFDSYHQKILRRLRGLDGECTSIEITDVLGMRIVCPFMDDLDRVETALREHFDVLEVERKGAEYSVREFGYASVHYLVQMPTDIRESFHLDRVLPVEVQLRTILQDAWAEVEHELVYKAEFSPFDEPLRRKLAALSANLSLSDIIFQEIRDYQRQLRFELRKRRDAFWATIQGAQDGVPSSAPKEQPERAAAVLGGGADSIDTLLLRALHAHNNGDYDTAVDLYSSILEREERQTILGVIYIHRGMARFSQGDYESATADFTRAIRVDPDNARAYYYRAVAHRLMHAPETALDDYNRCVEIDPFQFEALYGRARVLADLGRRDEALADCDAALRIDGDSAAVNTLRAHILATAASAPATSSPETEVGDQNEAPAAPPSDP